MSPEFMRAIQNRLSASDRDIVARELARSRPVVTLSPELVAQTAAAAQELQVRGSVSLGKLFPDDFCDAVCAHFLREPAFASHVPIYSAQPPRPLDFDRWSSPYASYATRSVLEAPGFIDVVLNSAILGAVVPYFGCLPLLYSINTFWTLPGRTGALTHGYHRDLDDFRFLAVFIYWTDVPSGEGEFHYIDRTHDYRQTNARLAETSLGEHLRIRWPDVSPTDALLLGSADGAGYGQDRELESAFQGWSRSFPGPRGSAVAADTFGLHRGSPPASRPRLVTWIRFGLYQNAAYEADRNRAPALREDVAAQYAAGGLSDLFSLLLPH